MANSTMANATTASVGGEGGVSRAEIIRVEAPRPPELLEFDGNPIGWPAFRDRFTAEVHDREHIDPVMKLIHLQKMCVGDAKNILGDWQPIAANYTRAWLTLREKFEDSYQIEQALVSRMLNMQSVRDETRTALRGLIDTATNATRQLQAVGVDIKSWDPMVIGMVLRLLPARVKDVWEQRRDVQRPPTLRDLLAFLEARARGKLYTDAKNMIPEGSRAVERASEGRQHSQAGQGRQHGWPACKLCRGQHPLFKCPVLENAQVPDRWRMVKNLGVCEACLKRHPGQCNRTCYACKGPHDHLLCRQQSVKQESKGARQQQ